MHQARSLGSSASWSSGGSRASLSSWASLSSLASLVLAAGCGSVKGPGEPDAAPDAPPDAPPDGPAACQPTVLLAGGTDVTAQGWTAASQVPFTVSNGADYVELVTTTPAGARTSGQALLHRPFVVVEGAPLALEVVMRIESVSPHNQLDAGAAFLASFTPPFGAGTDRSQMIYLYAAAVGWADDTQSRAFNVLDGAYHTYVLALDAARTATLTIDDAVMLTRSNFTTNGILALGDQTNDPGVDGSMRIRSVRQLCVP